MGWFWFGLLLVEFVLVYLQVVLEIDYLECFVDIIVEGFDFVIWVGELVDSCLVVRWLCVYWCIFGVVFDYLEWYGVLCILVDLVVYNCFGFSGLYLYLEWKLICQDEQQFVWVCGLMVSNDNEVLFCVVCQGLGIFVVGEWLMSCDFEVGRLVWVLLEW